jgi:predicted nucleotidyltransferase
MLIEIINTKRLFFNELFIYRKNNKKRINKDFIITKSSRVYKLIETRQCKAFDQSNKMQNIRMRLKKILLALTSKEI